MDKSENLLTGQQIPYLHRRVLWQFWGIYFRISELIYVGSQYTKSKRMLMS